MSRTAWIVVIVFVVVLVGLTVASWFVPVAFGNSFGYGMMGRNHMPFGPMGFGHMGFGGMMGGGLFGLLFWALILVGGVWLFMSLTRGRTLTGLTPVESPLDIAKRRYAKGEITKEQFDALKADIGA